MGYWFLPVALLTVVSGCATAASERTEIMVRDAAHAEPDRPDEAARPSIPVTPLEAASRPPGPLLTEPESGTTNFASCLGETRQAEVVGVELLVMLDTSGSMLDILPGENLSEGGQGRSKWEAVRDSLAQFVQEEASSEIGIGLQYFPLLVPDVPLTCSNNAECGPAGPCSNSVCLTVEELPNQDGPSLTVLTAPPGPLSSCGTDGDCSGQQVCRNWTGECVFPAGALGAFPNGAGLAEAYNTEGPALCAGQEDCLLLPGSRCELSGLCRGMAPEQTCTTQTLACPRGVCSPVVHVCSGQTKCDSADYANPAVLIRRDTNRSFDIVESLLSQQPEGRTPTGPALEGALQYAQLWAESHPRRQVVVVFATDGLPTECEPSDAISIAELARSAYTATSGIETFVIGVFGSEALDESGRAALDQIAVAGGTERALVIDANRSLSEDFLAALETIRDTAVSCEFQLDANIELNFEQVNLLTTTSLGIESALSKVNDLASCLGLEGWYYWSNSVGRPNEIRVCPTTCAALTDQGATVDLQIGCPTVLR